MAATNTYDAIIVGSGITGGWAAKELTEKGMNVLLLEAGRTIIPKKITWSTFRYGNSNTAGGTTGGARGNTADSAGVLLRLR